MFVCFCIGSLSVYIFAFLIKKNMKGKSSNDKQHYLLCYKQPLYWLVSAEKFSQNLEKRVSIKEKNVLLERCAQRFRDFRFHFERGKIEKGHYKSVFDYTRISLCVYCFSRSVDNYCASRKHFTTYKELLFNR